MVNVGQPGRAASPTDDLKGRIAAFLQIIAPHFFAFGGVLETARWMRKVAAGEFDIDASAGRLRIQGD